MEYRHADAGEKARVRDIRYLKKTFRNTRFVRLENIGHGGMAPTRPQQMADMLPDRIEGDNGK